MLDIEKKLKYLPSLSDNVSLILTLKYNKNYDSKKLLEIIEQDSILSARLLSLSNSKLFGFINPIHTPSRALSLYGMNFTTSICVCELILNTIRFHLSSYNVSYNQFQKSLDFSFKLLLEFFDEKKAEIKEKLIIPLFCQHIGKFIISDYLEKEGKTDSFKSLLGSTSISKAEKQMLGLSASELSSIVLKKWGFPEYITDLVFYIDTPMYTENNLKEICLLDVINTACNIKEPFSLESVNLALNKANEYDLDVNKLKRMIEKVKEEYSN